MKKDLWKKIGMSALRISAALAIIFGIPALCYLIWQPGSDRPFPEFKENAIWLGHGWLGDDGWFERNQRSKEKFRSEEKIEALFKKLAENKISIVYPHLCPAQFDGRIAPYDSNQLERFLTLAEKYHIRVIPWVGGILYESARPDDRKWVKNFFASVEELFKNHPRVTGIHLNIEPMPDGNREFCDFLAGLRKVVGERILSVAAYPPPTKWHQYPNVHWGISYFAELSKHCDQMAVMMYDTAIPLEKFYINLMTDWTQSLAGITQKNSTKLILGVPAYDDHGVGYHYPHVENMLSALRGISAAGRNCSIDGIAIYCNWEMDENEWQIWRKFIR